MNIKTEKINFEPVDYNRLINLCGPHDINIKQLENKLDIKINRFNNVFEIIGKELSVNAASYILYSLYLNIKPIKGITSNINPEQIQLAITESLLMLQIQHPSYKTINRSIINDNNNTIYIQSKKGIIKPLNKCQNIYLSNIFNYDIVFGIGPAGTGKTYLAIAAAIEHFKRKIIKNILLTKPAIEAGEKLGFLPGGLNDKIDPYLRPLYDALFDILGYEYVEKLIERNTIQIAPLAYMRGRTLNDAFIILDEGQNTTHSQMKMFLTRIGSNSKVVITGDITQIDLPKYQKSGLCDAIVILSKIKEISFNFFHNDSVIRHPIVKQIIRAYENWENTN